MKKFKDAKKALKSYELSKTPGNLQLTSILSLNIKLIKFKNFQLTKD